MSNKRNKIARAKAAAGHNRWPAIATATRVVIDTPCRKRKYAFECAAIRAITVMERKGIADRDRQGNPADPATLHAYRCPDCGFFHAGHARPEGAIR